MKLLICIVGGSGSGKSSLEDNIIINDGFTKVISHTTRKKRNGEHNGREYYFVSEKEFLELKNNNKFVESVKFSGNYYGLSKDELNKTDNHLVFVTEPNGLKHTLKYIDDNKLDIIPLIIYLDIPEKTRFKNMIKRGDNPIEIQERLKQENIKEEFESLNIKPQIKVTKLTPISSETIIEDIYKFINIIEKN